MITTIMQPMLPGYSECMNYCHTSNTFKRYAKPMPWGTTWQKIWDHTWLEKAWYGKPRTVTPTFDNQNYSLKTKSINMKCINCGFDFLKAMQQEGITNYKKDDWIICNDCLAIHRLKSRHEVYQVSIDEIKKIIDTGSPADAAHAAIILDMQSKKLDYLTKNN